MNNEEAWKALFERYHIVESIQRDGYYRISADTIKEYREPRLMAKFDFRSQLPSSFSVNNYSILPITRGDYLISDINTFQPLFNSTSVQLFERTFPNNIESLDFSSITSETIAINCAYVSGILSDFTEEEKLLPTVSGKMKSDKFSFKIQKLTTGNYLEVEVNNAQIEIDGGYEGERCLVLLEAKNKLCADFMIRQLYYPYRKWENKVSKTIKPIFFEYSNGIFHLREYLFENLRDYNSLVLVKEKRYRLKDSEVHISIQTIQELLQRTPIQPEPKDVPFPQADSFERIISLCEVLYNKEDDTYTKEVLNYDISFTGKADFTKRQVDYYTNAAIYLGLVEKEENTNPTQFVLTDLGMRILSTRSINERQIKYIQTIVTHQAFARVLREYLETSETPPMDKIVEIMKDCNLHNVRTEGMFKRRGSTIKSWVEWILGTIDE